MRSVRPLTAEAYRHLIDVSLRKAPATKWFKNVPYLNVYTGEIQRAHIHLAHNRIAYVGEREPLDSPATECIDIEPGHILVPGYIEPHAHPFQWYNPYTWGQFLLKQGTTTSINDNMFLFKFLNDEQALSFIERLDEEGDHLWLWWSRFDAQTALDQAEERFSAQTLRRWLSHRLVIQGGEFTSWPLLLNGNESIAESMLLTKQEFGKRIEGHLPGASNETLNALTAAGIGADHEALNGKDVLLRLRLGLYATLRYSSIRPDLPHILQEIKDEPELNMNRIMLTNDGSMPFFVEESGCDAMLSHVLEAGFTPEEAYRTVTLNPATYYGLDQDIGGIAPGRLANINVLSEMDQPTPVHVMSEGEWVIRAGEHTVAEQTPAWLAEYFPALSLDHTFDVAHISFDQEQGIGIQLMNEVITRAYEYDPHSPLQADESYLTLLDKQGKWVIHTRVKHFASGLQALASTYTASRDYLLLGKDKQKMKEALRYVLREGGGIYTQFQSGVDHFIPLPLAGGMSMEKMGDLQNHSLTFVERLQQQGHAFEDPIYTLLFLTATHLPFIRLTHRGIYSIKEQKILAPVTYL